MTNPSTQSAASSKLVEILHQADGRRRLVAVAPVGAGEEVIALTGVVRSAPTRHSIQIAENAHLDRMGAVDATNHACEPTAFVDFSDPERIVLRALRRLTPGTEVSIHYCATEFDMESPFDCDCGSLTCMGEIRGYAHMSDTQRLHLAAQLSPAPGSDCRI